MAKVSEIGLSALCCQPKWSGYPQSIFIAAVACILTTGQTMIMNSWSPITQVVESALHWSDGTVALVEFWFPLVLLFTAFPGAYIMETKGIRVAVLVGGTAMVIGAALRALPVASDSAFTILVNIGDLLVGLSTPVFPAGCSAIAVTWFPADTRATATSAIIASAVLGGALGFLMDSGIVHTIPATVMSLNASELSANSSSALLSDLNWRSTTRNEIWWLMFAQFLIVFIEWLPSIIYYPTKPDNAPSASAAEERAEFFSGLKDLVRSGNFWLLCSAFSLTVGLIPMWLPLLGIALRPLDVPNQMCGWIGCSATVATLPSIIVQSWIGQTYRKMKLVIVVSQFCGAGLFMIYGLMCQAVIPTNMAGVFAVVVLANAVTLGAISSYVELTCECCYPVFEGLVTISILFGSTIVSIIFYIPIILFSNSGFEVIWISWGPFVAVLGAAILMMFVKEDYKRLAVDSGKSDSTAEDHTDAKEDDEKTHLLHKSNSTEKVATEDSALPTVELNAED